MVTKAQILEFLAPFGSDAQFALDEEGVLVMAVDDPENRSLDIGDGPAGWCSECSASEGHTAQCPLGPNYGVLDFDENGRLFLATNPIPLSEATDLAQRLEHGVIVDLPALTLARGELAVRSAAHLSLERPS
jgi:hypothetical protein